MRRAFRCFFSLMCFLFSIVTLAQAPYGMHHVATRETSQSVLYDKFHQRFYGTVPGENAVYVIAEADGSLLGKINVPAAYSMDLSVDGSKLYVSSNVSILGQAAAQEIFVVDTSTLRVSEIVRPSASLSSNGQPLNNNLPMSVAALSNGKVAYSAYNVGVTGGSVYLVDPSTNIATFSTPINFYSGILKKSADGTSFVTVSANSAGEYVSLYDTSSGSYISNVNFSTTNNSDIAVNSDSSLILLGGHILCNRSLQQIADIAVAGQPTTLAWTSQGSGFSPDGTSIYVASTLNTTAPYPGGGTASYSNPVLYIYSTATHQLAKMLPLPAGTPAATTGYKGLAVGSSGKVLLADSTGFLQMDPASAPATLAGAVGQSFSTPHVTSPSAGTASSPETTTLSGVGFRSGVQAWFGQTPASSATVQNTNSMTVQPPAQAAGMADISLLFPDGWALLAPQAYSYGPVLQKLSVNAGSTAGGTTVTLYGNGLEAPTGTYPSILIGGRSASVSAATAYSVTFTTPPGSVGNADIQFTGKYGTTTLTKGFLYLDQKLIPNLQPLDMLVDNARQRIYVADANTGGIASVDIATLTSTPLFTPNAGGVSWMGLTPDGASLLALNTNNISLDLIDLASGKSTKTIIPTLGNTRDTWYPTRVAATANGTALVVLVSSTLSDNARVVEVNLSSGATTIVKDNLFAGTLLASSSDGKLVYIAVSNQDGSSGGPPMLWSAASDAIVKNAMAGEFGPGDLSTTDLGDRVIDFCYSLDQADSWLRFVTTCAPDSQLASQRSFVYGLTSHSSGSLSYIPTTLGVEIADIHHGETRLSIGDAEGSMKGPANLAITHDGAILFIAQPNGIGVVTLPAVPLSIGSLTPSIGSAAGGQTVVLRGSGFSSGTKVTVDGNSAAVQFVDSTQLVLTMPQVTAAMVPVTVTNLSGDTYTLDAAWDAHSIVIPTPTLTAVSPNSVPNGSTYQFTITGSNFMPDAQAFVNGVAGNTLFQSQSSLLATFSHIPGPGSQKVTVENLPNVTPSNAIAINTYNTTPVLGTLTPASISAGTQGFTLTAFCNMVLVPGSVVLWNGTPVPSQMYDQSHIIATIPASLIATAGTASISVQSPQTTPATSNTLTFTITPPIAAMSFGATSLPVGPTLVGGSATANFTITSTGGLPLVISSISAASSDFSITGCVTTLAQGQSCTATATFKPTNAPSGWLERSLVTVTSNATSTPTFALQGLVGQVAVTASPAGGMSLTRGKSGTVGLNFISYGYIPALTATMSCSGLPANASCSFAPSSISLLANSSGNSTASSTLTITTQAPTQAILAPHSIWPARHPFGIGAIAAAALCFLVRIPRRIRIQALTSVVVMLFLITASGCGSSSAPNNGGSTGSGGTGSGGGGTSTGGTPVGTYTITTTATFTTGATVTQTFSLTVN